MSLTEPSTEEALALFHSIEKDFPRDLGDDKWYDFHPHASSNLTLTSRRYILAISSISAGGYPDLSANLYQYLISKPEFQTPESRQALVRRLREALVKLVSVVGVPKPLEAIFSIARIERPEDRDYSFSRENWSSGPANLERGMGWLSQIYRHNHTATENTLACHKDFDWLSREITYGLYLSDHDIIGPIETELVVLSGIAMQNLETETGWHLRGTRRIG